MFGLFSSTRPAPLGDPCRLEARTLEAVAKHIQSGDVRRITVLTGAGISTAAGIPDFRSPGTGLYSNLARLNLPNAEAVFDIHYFRQHPEPFYYLAKELYPGKFHPTVSHAFIALLHKKGFLHVDFTQNIDCLERLAGVPDRRIIEAHGSFATQRCIDCRAEFDDERMCQHVEDEVVPRCDGCNGLVKPDIVFFGEPLPAAFRDNVHKVLLADLVIIIGTSLSVYPFASLAEMVPSGIPRLLLNKQRVGRIGDRSDDVFELGPCDDGVRKLADLLGWRDELEALWRSVVGDQEADRQLGKTAAGPPDLDEEVRKLTDGVESGMKLAETQGTGNASEEEQKAEGKAEKENEKEETSAESVADKHDRDPSTLAAVLGSQDKVGESASKADHPDHASAPGSTDRKTQPAVSTDAKDQTESISTAVASSDPSPEDKDPVKEATSTPP